MELHEYQTKSLLSRWGIPITPYIVLKSYETIEEQIRASGIHQGVIKIQIHAGGRGKASGVRIGKTVEELIEHSHDMFGKRFVTPQTGPDGLPVNSLILTPLVDIETEYYLSLVVDRKAGSVMVIASTEGGVEIEEVARNNPKKIHKEVVPDSMRLRRFQVQRLLKALRWNNSLAERGTQIIDSLTQLFFRYDLLSLEINPLVLTRQGTLLALDGKASVDDNALFRQKELAAIFDTSQLHKLELEAKKVDLAYIAMQGNIGCMVNGAGLAMATMDLIRYWGGSPANFLDVGGGASEDKVIQGFNIILSDQSVTAVLVNIFGGIMNCQIIAEALIKAIKHSPRSVPIVVRMEGTHVQEAKARLIESKIPLYFAKDLDDAAKRVVEIAKKASLEKKV